MIESKKEQRKQIKSIFRAKNTQELDLESTLIMKNLEQSDEFRSAGVVAMYHSLEDEPKTHAFIRKWAEVKTILLPVVKGEQMCFCTYNIGASLSEGAFSILEPSLAQIYQGEIDLVVVPAVAYDKTGVRLGRGKGYYDKFFARHAAVKTLGVCFSFQLLDSVPTEVHDKRVDRVITSL